MNSVIDEIKARLDIVSLISEYIQLKPAGTNYKALCPFHQEKTPSFFVSPERQIWHCFGCGSGSSIFDFVMKIESIEFPEALRILAKKADIVLTREDPQIISQKTRLLDICQQASQFYHQTLKSPLGEMARKYLKERQITPETIKEFQLGYASNSWNAISKFLQQKGFKPAEILASGLVVQRAEFKSPQTAGLQSPAGTKDLKLQTGYYDRFRHRLMFPLSDVHGNTVGFTGRILINQQSTANSQQAEAKYINTPQTLIYNKSRILYGIDKAKQEIREKKLAVIVEGQMDVLASHQAGIKNVVASSGTALTLDQIKLIKRFTPNLALAFDIDPAGQEATKRGIETAWQEEMDVKIIVLAQKDPDELIKKDVVLWQKAIEKARPIMEYYFETIFQNRDLSKVEEKKSIAKILLAIIAKLKDKIEQDFWLKKLAAKLDVQEESLREKVREAVRISMGHADGVVGRITSILTKNRNLMLSERLVGFLLKFPKELENIIKNLEPKILASLRLQELAGFLPDNSVVPAAKLSPQQRDYLQTLLLLVEKDFPEEPDSKEIVIEAEKIWQELQKNYFLKELKSIEKQLKRAEEEKKMDQAKALSEKFEKLTKGLGVLENF